jgi:ornithine--oxo-acid transaminase
VTLTARARASASVAAGADVRRVRRYLMCAPSYFDVEYQINPWMRPDEPVSRDCALEQWTRLRDVLTTLGHEVTVMPAQPDLPDLVFAANGGIAIGDRALVPRFRHAERAPEAAHYSAAMRALGIRDIHWARNVNEGEGDFRLAGRYILAGYGLRSTRAAVEEVTDVFGLQTVPLRLVDPRFYHLDTALAVLDERTVTYWPGAFDAASRDVLSARYPDAVLATEADAAQLGLNMVSDGRRVIMTPDCPDLAAKITERGFEVVPVATDELRKAGGGAKCCVLEWHPDPIGE